jgi:hypothetical protein
MGPEHLTTEREASASGSRWGRRKCLRKGCQREFRPRQWNQRYCREPECLREVKRWQAAKRQRQRRATAEGRQRHAEEERQRRKRDSAPAGGPANEPVGVDTADALAWSRSAKNLPEIFCDRPGCYEPPRPSAPATAHYCSDACREAMRRVRDRERKYLARKTQAGRLKRQQEYRAAKLKRCQALPSRHRFRGDSSSVQPGPSPGSVLGSGRDGGRRLGFPGPQEVTTDDSETTLGPRPRASPAS